MTMADNNDNAIAYQTTIDGAMPGDTHAVADPPVPAPAMGLERQILDYRPQGPEQKNNLPLLDYIPRDPVPGDQQKG